MSVNEFTNNELDYLNGGDYLSKLYREKESERAQ